MRRRPARHERPRGLQTAVSVADRPLRASAGCGPAGSDAREARDVPLTHLRFRCSNCGSDRTEFVVTSRDNPQPW